MQASEQVRLDALYAKHLAAIKRHVKSNKTIDSYARALLRMARYADRCPDDLSVEKLERYRATTILPG